jgi:alpha-N-arabinofuranosidase
VSGIKGSSKIGVWVLAALLGTLPLVCVSHARAQTKAAPTAAPSFRATLSVRADQPGASIARTVYGSFAEHLGRGIYEGIWVGTDSPIPNTRGIRNDVIAALKKLKLGILRWPGGCYADEYHWRDGIGPRKARPRRLNTSWGGIETNEFGLHEFMDLAEAIGTEPYISVNVGSGTPQEMMDWLEYMSSDSDSELAQLRRKNGRQQPWKVDYVGIGNENWGCGGNMTAEHYANEYKKFATFVKSYSGHGFQRIACGAGGGDYKWTEVLMAQAGKHFDGLSLHHYTLPTGDWGKKGLATGFSEAEWVSTLKKTLHMAELLDKHSAIMDKYDPKKRVALVVDEWGTWYDPEPGTRPSALYQQNTLRDAVVAGINLNLFNQHADRVKVAALAQAVNVLQAVLLTDKAKLVLTPTYHVLEMYSVHQGATLLPVELSVPSYGVGKQSLPGLHASASRDARGVVHVSLVNLDPQRSAQLTLRTKGSKRERASARTLTAARMDALNSFEAPNAVVPAPLEGIQVQPDHVTLTLPAKSVTVLRLE